MFFHEGDEDSKGTCVELIQTRLHVLNIYNKDKVAQKEGDLEEGYLGWLCPVSYSLSEMAHYWMAAINPGWPQTGRQTAPSQSPCASCILWDKTKRLQRPRVVCKQSCLHWMIKSGLGGSLGTFLPSRSLWLNPEWHYSSNIWVLFWGI